LEAGRLKSGVSVVCHHELVDADADVWVEFEESAFGILGRA
jgi:hypothetical protein